MTFLNAALLPGLFLVVGIPLLVHLLNRRSPQQFYFSSVQNIRQTLAQRSRLFRWRHLILLTLRTLFAAALLVVFLKPVLPRYGSAGQNKAGRCVLLLLDHTMSMEYKGSGLSCRQRAETEINKIFATLGPDDLVNVMLMGLGSPTCFESFSRDHASAVRFVQKIPPGLGVGDFTHANAAAARLLGKVAPGAELYYLSDFQRKNWAHVDFTALPAQTRFFFVDVGAKTTSNRAILGATMKPVQVLAGSSVAVEVEVGNFSDLPMQEPLRIVLDARASFEKEVSVPPWSVSKLTVPISPGAPGIHLCEISLAPDMLTQDDRFFLTIPVLEKEGVLLISDAQDSNDAVRYLRTALNPFGNLGGTLLLSQVKGTQLAAADLAAVRKVFLTRAGSLSEASCKLIADFVYHGGGLVYFLDGENDGQNLALLERAMHSLALPLRVGEKRVARNVGSGLQQISRGDFKSRFLSLFRGTQRQNLALLEFYDIRDATATGSGQVLLSYADETPAMAVLNHGLGTLLLMNFSVSGLSSNVARQRIFPAWIQDIVKNLAADETVANSSLVGDPVEDEIWKAEITATPLHKPSGQLLEVRSEPMGSRAAISFVPEEIGFYTMRADRLLHAYGVNSRPEESDLRPIDRNFLSGKLNDRGQRGFFVAGSEDFQDLARGHPVFHWFVFASLVFILMEMFFLFTVTGRAPDETP